MKKHISAIILMAVVSLLAGASLRAADKVTVRPGAGISNVAVDRSGRNINVNMDVDLTKVSIPGNKAYLLTPVLVKGSNSVELPAIGLYSSGSFLQYLRNGSKLSAGETMTYSVKNMPSSVKYDVTVPYESWMNGCDLVLRQEQYGCANCKEISSTSDRLGGYRIKTFTFSPDFVFARPEAEVTKSRSISGQAFVDFPQGKSTVNPDYHSNARELAKIRATIDSVRKDKDVTINRIFIKGFASPEGKYSLNEKLASARTTAIKDYVKNLYSLSNSLFKTDFVPENWEALREYVDNSNLPHRVRILDLIDDDETYTDLDAKEWKIKSTYPDDYKNILENCYPFLRRTDYKVDYTIRSYASAEEVEEVLKTRPGNLSLEEFYLAAQNYTPGDEDFNKTFITAARVYPDDPTANINAAMAEMQEGDLAAARRYLKKAGDSGLAAYAKGLYAALNEDFDEAWDYFKQARSAGVREAQDALDQLNYRKEILGL
ncbi:MAG: DUF3868 domain-containing protein [Bacteroidales bacterium]|nr:DUF3868 domain-containing protein [Bacteroidales bacterium]MBQ2197537.1 DUF3868 domain-containing protein [Bacteroidales bacterium]MBQ5411138.1 DUF3868 domain-containing protein [Bacteroidales bacterium]MBQ5486169.1 DUF3868 domain-containing protein [Bacteroidales bacterium]